MIFGYCLNPAHVILSLIVRMGCDLESIVIKKKEKGEHLLCMCNTMRWRQMANNEFNTSVESDKLNGQSATTFGSLRTF
jgi:hypothetical protein